MRGLIVRYRMGLVVTGIKCVSTSSRFLKQLLRGHLLELGPKLNEATPQNYHAYFVKYQTLKILFTVEMTTANSYTLFCNYITCTCIRICDVRLILNHGFGSCLCQGVKFVT